MKMTVFSACMNESESAGKAQAGLKFPRKLCGGRGWL
jgi:hypothetical protein